MSSRSRGVHPRARVVLIRPPTVVTRFALTLDATPPIAIAYLASSLRARGHDVTCIDAVGDGLDVFGPGYAPDLLFHGLAIDDVVARVDPIADLVGVSCMFSHEWPLIRTLLARLAERCPRAVLVLGGEHATAAPELCLAQAPGLRACAVGEGEETIVELAEAAVAGTPVENVAGLVVRAGSATVPTGSRARIRDIDAIALPAWDLVPLEGYLDRGLSFGVDRGRTVPIMATRGCPYQCTFCSSPRMWTTRYTTRDPVLVVDEIEQYVQRYAVRNIDFYDLTAIVKRGWILRFCDEMIRRRIDACWQLPSGTRSEAMDAEVCERMYQAGCRNVSYAPESGSERTLERIKKKIRLDRMLESMQSAVRSGLNVKANILIGFPDETHQDIQDSMRFMLKMARVGVHDVSVWTFSPYPGSELFDQLRAAGKIRDVDDRFFASLLSYSNVAGAVSHCDAVSARWLHSYRLAGLAGFYAASYARRPARPLRTAANVITGRFESRLEMSLANLVRRLRSESRDHAA